MSKENTTLRDLFNRKTTSFKLNDTVTCIVSRKEYNNFIEQERKHIESAHMAGQRNAGIDPSANEAAAYFNKTFVTSAFVKNRIEGCMLISEFLELEKSAFPFEDGTYGYMVITNESSIPQNYHCSDLRYDYSWDWQIPPCSKLIAAIKELARKDMLLYETYYRTTLNSYESAVFRNDPMQGFETILDGIKWLQKNLPSNESSETKS